MVALSSSANNIWGGGSKAKVCRDAAKDAERLLDIMSLTKVVATALDEFREKHGKRQTKGALADLQLISSSLRRICDDGTKQVAKVSQVPYLLKSYNMNKAAERREAEVYTNKRVSEAIAKLKAFEKAGKNPEILNQKDTNKSPALGCVDSTTPKPAKKHRVLSYRRGCNSTAVTPDKDGNDIVISGEPPDNKWWKKEELVDALWKLEGTRKTTLFVKAVLEVGKTSYTNRTSIVKLYGKWKKTKTIPKGTGRPATNITVEEAKEAVKNNLNSHTSGSNAFGLDDMKAAIIARRKEQAAKNGLDPDGIDCTVSNQAAKIAMTSAVMGQSASGLKFTNKDLLRKTEPRFISEHSLMMGYAYAATVLSTHFIAGTLPSNLQRKYHPECMSVAAKETIDWVKKAYGDEEVYPVDPNLVMSTDDTTVFAFEGMKDGIGKWEWKLVDQTQGDSSVRSDFEVSNDAENSGGLRVRLTFTFTASGLAAPPYVAVSGLTDEELCPKKCPGGILATEVEGLCKGGDDLFNSGAGWLVFLRADKKENGEKETDWMSIANKKFIHYNDDVLLPFIQSIRKKLGCIPGQPVPEWAKCCSWFDGDIGQLQTMLYETRESLDKAERIIRNKHSAAATGTQQPCDLSPVFRLLKAMQARVTMKDEVAVGLRDDIEELFAIHLAQKGLKLGYRKKKALVDFLLCLPEILESVMKKKNIKKGFVEGGMVDEETGVVPVFDKLMGTCKRWISFDSDIGVKKEVKLHCREQFQSLMHTQMENGQISYADMKSHGIPLGE